MTRQRIAKGIAWAVGSIFGVLFVGWLIVGNLSNMDAVVQWVKGESPTQALIGALDPLQLAALAFVAGLILGSLGTYFVSRSVHTEAEADRQQVLRNQALQEKAVEHSRAMGSARESCQRQIDLLNEEKANLQKHADRTEAEARSFKARLDEKPAPPRLVMHFDPKDCLERTHASQTVWIKVTNEGGQSTRIHGLSIERVVIDGGDRNYDKSAFFPLKVPNGAFECDIPSKASRHFRVLYQTGQHATYGAMTEFAPKTLRESKFPVTASLQLTLRLQADFGEPLKEFRFVPRPKGDREWGLLDYADEAVGELKPP